MSQTCSVSSSLATSAPNTFRVKALERQLNWTFEENPKDHNSVTLWQKH